MQLQHIPFRRIAILLVLFIGLSNIAQAQSGTEFWLAPPDISDSHGSDPLNVFVSSNGQPATVTIDQPANPSFTPIVVILEANKSQKVNLTAFKTMLETRPTNTVLNTGLRVVSTTSITCYYECANGTNTDIWALKGPNSLGTEFYIPLHKHAPFYNHTFANPHQAIASFDICATQNNTQVTIYTPTPVDGHPALSQFTITLNQGQTYSCGWTGTDYTLTSTHPSGAVVLADKNITVSIKDDSNHNPSGGCYDIMGDQIVPVEILGTDYIAVKGSLNTTGDESVVLLATQNNTQVFVNGNATPVATLFAGEYYRVDMDYLSASTDNSVYVRCSKPTYAMHITGFGCEAGIAQLPPLNCAGSQQLNFTRGTSETFYVTVLCRSTAVNGFALQGSGTATIPATAFLDVPGTAGVWKSARITYNTTQAPVDSTFRVTNSIDVFALGIVNGGSTTGCRYGYFSEFVAPIAASAGDNQTICANTSATLSGLVAGGTTTGEWTTSGSGTFTPSATALNAVYTPSAGDAAVGSVVITLTSTGACNPVSDQMLLTILPAPIANAGTDMTRCRNNSNVQLNGVVTNATGGVWTGGNGIYTPGNNVLNAIYTPTPLELISGSLALTLTTTGNGLCNPVSDNVVITFTIAPTVNAGANQTKCANNAATQLSGSVTVATGATWAGVDGSFSPSASSLNAIYTPTAAEIANGSVTLTLTTTGNGICNSVSDQMTIFFTAAPQIDAGANQTKCANNAVTQLNATVSVATGIQWSGGLGLFLPNNTAPNATYTPTTADINNGSVTLTVVSTGNGTCNEVTDQVTIFFTPAPTVNAGNDITICANNATATLNGSFTIASGAIWSGGSGTFSPNNLATNATYTPTPSEISNGSVTLTLTSTGNGTCTAVNDIVVITITPAPTVNAGNNITACSNNPTVTLNGSVTVASGGTWSGGLGNFNPSANALNAVYTPTASEIANGNVTLTLTSTGNGSCMAVSDNMSISFTASPTANAGIDQTKCANNAVIQLNGAVTIATGGQWTGGLGIYSPNANALNATYTPTTSEINSGSITLTLTTTGNGTCNAVTDQLTIAFTAAPTAIAGNDFTICANNAIANLNGSFTIATGAVWSGGNGTYSPNNTSMNASYTPTPSEIESGSVTLTLTTTGIGNCSAVSDNVVISISPSPIANAGTDISACANNISTALNGQIFGASGGTWTGGEGTFFPNNNVLNATYTPSANEVSNGIVTLTLTSTGNGTCNAVSDQLNIIYAPAPIVNAGIDQTLCGNNATIQLNGSVSQSNGGQWSGGLGIFTPSANALNATYAPTATEISQGFVILTLTSTGNGNCNAVEDEITISFTPAPTSNAGDDLTSCANNAQVQLNGSFTIATGALWSGGSGSYSPSGNVMDALYTPTNDEINEGEVTLTLTTTGNGTCLPVTNDVIITIVPSPIVSAGQDQVVCVNNLNVALSGSIVGITNSGAWTSTGTGTFLPNNNSLNATYVLSTADSTAGGVTLTLTSTNNESCNSVADQMQITVLPAGTANAGNDVSVCGNNALVNLNGAVGGGATSGVWSTSGTGIFSPSNSTLNANYVPSPFDIASGSVTLSLNANSCNTAMDALTVTITAAPEVNAGMNQTVCSSETQIELNGSLAGSGSSAIWTTNGTGTFTPSATSLNASYSPTANDIEAQEIYFILTTTNNGNCIAVVDTTFVNIYPNGTVNAGTDEIRCANNPNVELNGSLGGGATEGIWSTSGSGFFIPNAEALNATYIPSQADIISENINLVLTATNSCNTAIDFINVLFTPAPQVSAGDDQSTCGVNPNVVLNGTISNAAGGIWSGGAGSFIPNNTALNAIYVPTTSEQTNGSVTLTLTSTGNGLCNEEVDQVVINFSTGVIVNAGVDQSVCTSSTFTMLQGSVANGSTTGTWTTLGSGTFTPDANALNAIYYFSIADLASESITLVLTSTNNGICPVSTDTLEITFGNAAFAYAGNDQNICASFEEINLNGLIGGGATQGIWTTTGFGSFDPDNTSTQTTYLISPTDVANGEVTFTLSTTDHGTCLPGDDEVTFTISQSSEVNAGADLSVCADDMQVQLQGAVSGASSSGVWTTNGSGQFVPNNIDLNAQYFPSANDSLNGEVIITLTSTNTGLCPIATDALTISIEKTAIVNAGNDLSLCAELSSIQLNGTISGGTQTGVWSSSGTGTFSPDNQTLNATYNASSSDISLGQVELYLTSTGLSVCNNTSDTLQISFTSLSNANAGANISICGISEVQLSGNISGPSNTGVWSTLGSGNFSPDNTTLNGTYMPSLNDSINGTVQLILTATNTGLCSPDSDTLIVTINTASQVNAGNDQSICATQDAVALNGSITGQLQTGTWTTTGSGTFNPNNQTLNATYSPSAADVLNGSILLMLNSASNGACVSTQDELTITFTPQETVNAGNDRILCDDAESMELGGIISGENATGIWTTTGTGTFTPSPSNLNATYQFTASDVTIGELLFILTPTSASLCPAQPDTFMVNLVSAPTAAFNAITDDSLNVSFTDESIGAGTWFWDFGIGGTSTVQNPTYTYPESGSYDVTLIVTAAGGCADTAFATVRVLGEDVKPIAIPTGFSPNNDGSNDALHVLGGPFVEVDFRVYNGWGNLLFSTTDQNVGWDGTYKGEPQPGGVYVYTATGVTTTGRRIKASGSVTLIR